jgi:CRP/FNR family transcriptional regulator
MSKSNADNSLSLAKLKVACQECSLNEICLPVGVDKEDMSKLDDIINRKTPYARGQSLFNIGDNFKALYAIRSGSVKTYTSTEDGHEQVTGFHLPGELVGLDAIATNQHPVAAKALETTSICEIPFEQLDDLSCKVNGIRRQLMRIMSREIQDDQENMMMLGQKTAEQRLASLLISLSNRYRARGFSPYEFNLTMSRGDIGNFLGLALETVSRLFGRFQDDGLIRVNRKNIEIVDRDKLCTLSGAKCADLKKFAE